MGSGIVVVESNSENRDRALTAARLLEKLCKRGEIYYEELSNLEKDVVKHLQERGVVTIVNTGIGWSGAAIFSTIGFLTAGPIGLVFGAAAKWLTDEVIVEIKMREACHGNTVIRM